MGINLKAIPNDLKNYQSWVCWQLKEIIKGKPTKIPKNPHTGGYAKSNEPQTWSGFEDTCKFLNSNGKRADGIGFVVSSDDPFTGIDLDHCRDPQTGVIETWAMEIIKGGNSYTEITPSGTGIRIFVKGNVPRGRKKGDIEAYSSGRFFTVTGNHLEGAPTTIEPRQTELDSFYKKYFGDNELQEKIIPKPIIPTSLRDQEIIEKALHSKNGDKFKPLWEGNWSDYPSQSEADLALCSMLAFWTGNDPVRIDQLFRQSGLMRHKWDEKHFGDGRTYGQSTIEKAIEGTIEVYPKPQKSNGTEATSKKTLDIYNPIQKVTQPGEEALLKYHLTDVGNAECFYEQHGIDFLFIKEKRIWVKFDGVRWGDAKEEIKRKMIQTVRLKSQIAMKVFPADSDQMKQIVKWCLGSESNYRLSAAMDIATIYTTKSNNDFDNDPWLLACKNGVIDLRTGILRTATPDDMLQKSINLAYDPRAVCPRWIQFLEEILRKDRELIDFMQKAIGYTLTGETREQLLFMLYGIGANGKSVFLGVLEGLLGEYGQTTSFSTFKEKYYDSIPNDIARIAGARMVKSVEIKEGAKLNEERIKSLTGGDRMMARFLHNEYFEFDPIAKFWIAVNHKPVIRGTDEAIWRRVQLIPFEETFPPERRDKELPQKLKKELPGILNWAIEGCLRYQEHGLPPVKKIQEATNTYRAESDLIAQFIENKTIKVLTGKIKAGDLYRAYESWCREQGEFVITGTRFGKRMEEKGFLKKKDGYVYYLGLELI